MSPALTPLPITDLRGVVATDGNDPASLEIAGDSFILSVGEISNGLWRPGQAEWLFGTVLRRVIAIPANDELNTKLTTLAPNETLLHLRLRSGEVVSYRLRSISRFRRDQIEVLAAKEPSIAVIVHGEQGDERTLLLGQAIQGADSLTVEGQSTFSAEITTPEASIEPTSVAFE